jgi:peptidoglycan/xylan/chitin deacetylase (PgdA/CDA1 family)
MRDAIAPLAGLILLLLLAMGLLVALWPSLVVRHLLQPLFPEVIFCGDGRRRELALTIDDGPSPERRRPAAWPCWPCCGSWSCPPPCL